LGLIKPYYFIIQEHMTSGAYANEVLSRFMCKSFIGQFIEERQVLTHFSYRV